jgi:hypothetical protein
MPRADRDPLIADIKRHNPTKLLVQLRDGDSRTIPISAKSNRWERLLETLGAVPWDTIECLNASGDTLAIIESEADADEDASAKHADMRAMANVLLDVMKSTQKATAQQYDAQMTAFVELSTQVMNGLKVVQESYGLAMRVQATAQAQTAIADAGSGDGDVFKLMQMAMAMQQSKPAAPEAAPRLPPKRAPQPKPVQQPAHANGVAS